MSLDAEGLNVKLYHDLGGIEIYHEEFICTWRDKDRVYSRGVFTSICVGVRV